MSRVALILCVVMFVGLMLVLSEMRWFARRPMHERLGPYAPGQPPRSSAGGILSVESFREVIAPLANHVGSRLAAAFGVHEDLSIRLDRIHSTVDPTQFRLRQAAWALGAFLVAALASLAVDAPPMVGFMFVMSAPLLAFLVLEQHLSIQSADWQRRIFAELPVVSEHLGMLLGAGYSLAAAVNRVSERSSGVCARDLVRVSARMRQGLSDIDALREWAATADVVALRRLVEVLSLNRQAADLSRLITHEARNIRREAQRELIETIERRTQMVWIPVTVAALIPGVIFMAVPFVDALALFSGG